MRSPRQISNWLTKRLNELQNDAEPLDPNNNAYQSFLTDYILPDIEAKQRMLKRHQPTEHKTGSLVFVCTTCVRVNPTWPENSDEDCCHEPEPWPCNAIREAAYPFAEQTGYRSAWKPDTDPETDPA